jgi:hypothetical protein
MGNYTTLGNRRPWSLLAYTVADDFSSGDPIDRPMLRELKQLCVAADQTALSMAAQVDFKSHPGICRAAVVPHDRSSGLTPASPGSRSVWHAIEAHIRHSTLDLHRSRKDANSARATVFRDFLKCGAEECPAERYLLFMYGHSSGPMGLFFDRDPGHDARTLRLDHLAESVRTFDGKVAVVIFRDCYMSTFEAAFELRGVVPFMIASQSEVPIHGQWPWIEMMSALVDGGDTDNIGVSLIRHLADFLGDRKNRTPFTNAPISLVDTSMTEIVRDPLKGIVDHLQAGRKDRARAARYAECLEGARIGHNTPNEPGDPALVDVLTMCANLEALAPDPVAAEAAGLRELVGGRLVPMHFAQLSVGHCGISLYYRPTSARDLRQSNIAAEGQTQKDDERYYRGLRLCQETGWDRIALDPFETSTHGKA